MAESNEDIRERRTSPYCSSVRFRIVYTKRILVILLLVILVVPLLYLIPSATTKVRLTIQSDCTYEPFTLIGFNKTALSYENISIAKNSGNNDWKVQSIELYLNSYSRNVNSSTMIQYVIYHKNIPSLNSYNNMKIILFQNDSGYKIDNCCPIFNLNGYSSLSVCPVDYILSYIKITLVSTNDNILFSLEFYHFFQENKYTELKYSLSTEIKVKALTFNSTTFEEWNNWSFNNGTMPNNYPYLIDTEIRRYNGWNDRLGVENI